MASAKARFYANQAKKGKISNAQANSAISGRGISSPKSSTSMSESQRQAQIGALQSKYQGGSGLETPQWSNADATELKRLQTVKTENDPLAYQAQQKKNIADAKSKGNPKQVASNWQPAQDFQSSPQSTPITPGAPQAISASRQAAAGATGTSNSTNSPWRSALDKGLSIAKNIVPGASAASDFIHSRGLDVTNLLGIPKAQGAWDGYTPQQASADQQLFQSQNQDLKNSGVVFDNSGNVDLAASNFNLSNGWKNQNNNTYNTPKNTPHQTNQSYQTPFFNAPQSNPLIDAMSSFQPRQEVQAPQQDAPNFAPSQQDTGTHQQLFGGGKLSNGMASNGQGNYGFQGSTGGGTNLVQDLLNKLLGIDTASAAEPQNFGQQEMSQSVTPYSQIQQGFNNGGLTLDSGYNMPSFGPNMNADTPAPAAPPMTDRTGGYGSGGVAQSYAQPQSNAMSLMQQQSNGFGAQEKAQKKALSELIKSIENQYKSQGDLLNTDFTNQQNTLNSQYDTQQKQGQSDLEKAKQADLMQLSGLMNFNANQSPDSEQRVQYQQRAQDQSNTALKDFLTKLSTARGTDLSSLLSTFNTNKMNLQQGQNKDISGAKQNYQQALAQIAQQKGSMQMEIAKMQDAANAARIKSGASSMGLNSSAVGSLQSYLSGVRGQDGYVNPQDYAQAQQAFAQDFPTKASSFSALFPIHQYVSPTEYKNIYGSSQPPINIDFGGMNQ